MRLSLLASALLISSLSAHADTLTETVTTGPLSTTLIPQSFDLQIGGFNPNAGTLNAVTFAVDGNYTVANGNSDFSYFVTSGSNIKLGIADNQAESQPGTYSIALNTVDTDSTDLAFFTNPGLLNLDFNYFDALGATDTSTGLGLSVTYDYTSVPPASATPEPPSLALLGTGVLGAVGMLRRRRKRC